MKQHEQRVRARIRMELPVRIRQVGPPHDSVEITNSLDVSRNGVLFRTRQPYTTNSTVWVTMPYHPEGGRNNLEFPASVVRIDKADDEFAEIAVQFHSARADQMRPAYQAAPASGPQRSSNRRSNNRVRMTLPIRVRDRKALEESVTVDVSRTGVLFSSSRPYAVGEQVWVAMPYQPGAAPDEMPAQVIRTIDRPRGAHVALQFVSSSSKHSPLGSYYAR